MSPVLRRAAVVVTASLSASCAARATAPPSAPSAPPPASGKRPNIVLIVTDDMDLSGLDRMPSLRSRLVEQGTTFTNGFVTTSVCGPSRASLLTGKYVHSHGVLDNRAPLGGFRKFFESGQEKETVATWLQAAGYRTGLVGKYMNFYPQKVKAPKYVPPGWDDWQGLFFPETYLGYTVNANGTLEEYGTAHEEYQTDVLRRKTMDFVNKGDGRPFFLYLAPFAPHAPAWPAPRHEGTLPRLSAPRPPSFNEDDVSDKPAWVQALPSMTEEAVAKTDDWFHRRAETLLAVDELIADLCETLERKGELANTYIVFTSDNGFQLGAHRMDHGKGDAYEESIRVPFIVRGPGVPAGRRLAPMVLNIDLAPTLAALGGATVPADVDGRSIVPLLRGQTPKAWRQDFLIEHWTNDEDGLPAYAALRTADHLYVEYAEEKELYDLKKDPYQLQSQHASADAGLLRRLTARLQTLKTCRGAGCS